MSPAFFISQGVFPFAGKGLSKPSALCSQPQADPMIFPQLTSLFGERPFKVVLVSLMPAAPDKVFGLGSLIGALTLYALFNVPGFYPAIGTGCVVLLSTRRNKAHAFQTN